ncbi:MAG: hypothetical protein Rpha_1393 [Candidatus Ruthia sp. Apha_13_S6]|nr:hypothetical protein [Candidatus Ruthia sp. Apha_13_S6]
MALAIFQSVWVMRLIISASEYSLTFKVKSDYNGPIILHEDRLDYENI